MLPRSSLRKRTAPDVEKRGSQDGLVSEDTPRPHAGDSATGSSGSGKFAPSGLLVVGGLAGVVVLGLMRHLIFQEPTGPMGAPSIPLDSRTQPPSAMALAQVSEAIYDRMRQRRARSLVEAGGISGINPFDTTHGVYIWDWFTPDWNCPDRERIGPVGDGGKWTCGIDRLKRHDGSRCLMYSFGVRDDSRFELEVIKRVGCEVHAFDPTVGGLPPDAAVEPRIHYHKQAVGPKSGHDSNFLVVESILDTMARLGHQWIDILKIDVEASEWSVFEALFKAGKVPFGQILIELHYADAKEAFSFFEGLEKHDFRIFARETNHQPCVAGRLPVAVEFSLIRSPLAAWPPPPSMRVAPVAPTGAKAAVWMLGHAGRVNELVRTVRSLASGLFVSWNLRGHYPLFIYAPAEDLDTIRTACAPIGVDGGFEIHFEPAAVKAADWPAFAETGSCTEGAGGASYWAAEFEVRKTLSQRFEWLMHVGDDAELVKPFGYDPFVMMEEVGKSYGVLGGIRPVDDFYPPSKCFEKLSEAARAYASKSGLKTKLDLSLGRPAKPSPKAPAPLPLLLNEQIELSRSSLFRPGSAYAEVHEALSGVPGAHSPLFGDGPLHTMHAALVVPEDQWHVFSDVGIALRGGRSRRLALGLPPPVPRSPLAKGGVLHGFAGGNGTNGTSGTNGTNGTNGTTGTAGGEYPRQKGAMYVLADGNRLHRLIEMLQSFDLYFNRRFNYPIVVFEEQLLPVQKARLSAATHSPLTFVPVDFRLPAFISEESVPMQTGCLPERGLGYRHMCRFQAGVVNMKLAELGFEYHWRMDDDSLLTGEVPYDVFGFMASKGMQYGFVSTVRDDDACIVDLWDTAKTYAQRSGASTKNNWFQEWPRGAVFYNNFEIAHASVFTSPEYRAYFDHIDQNGGIYMRRWGDAPIKSIAVSLFVPPEKVHRFGDIGYRHMPFIDQMPESMRGNMGGGVGRHIPARAALAWKQEKPVRSVIGRFHIEAVPDAELQELLTPAVTSQASWLGADIATSVRISADTNGLEEYVWLFGDTLIGTVEKTEDGLRRVKRDKQSGGFMVHNSVGAIKVDPRSRRPAERMAFSWTPQAAAGQGDRPALSFPSGDKSATDYVWPLAGISYCQGGSACKLIILGSHCSDMPAAVAAVLKADPFMVKGSTAIVVHNPQDSPELWTYDVKRLQSPSYDGLVMWHAGLTRANEQGLPDENGMFAYILGALGGWTTQVLARVPVAEMAKLDFKNMQVWSTVAAGAPPAWNLQSALPSGDHFAKRLVTIGGVGESTQEAGMWYDKTMQLWFIPVMDGDNIVLRTAATLTGPWASHTVYKVPERFSGGEGYMTYAVKAHPEFAGDGEIVLTYNVNMYDNPLMGRFFDAGEADTYVPQFLRLKIKG